MGAAVDSAVLVVVWSCSERATILICPRRVNCSTARCRTAAAQQRRQHGKAVQMLRGEAGAVSIKARAIPFWIVDKKALEVL